MQPPTMSGAQGRLPGQALSTGLLEGGRSVWGLGGGGDRLAGGERAGAGTDSRVGSQRILHLFLKGWDVIEGT